MNSRNLTVVHATLLEPVCQLWLRHAETRRSVRVKSVNVSLFHSLRLVQSIRDRFCKSGGIYEFATATKTRLNIVDGSKITYDGLFVVQPDVLEPLLSYW